MQSSSALVALVLRMPSRWKARRLRSGSSTLTTPGAVTWGANQTGNRSAVRPGGQAGAAGSTATGGAGTGAGATTTGGGSTTTVPPNPGAGWR